MRMRWRWFGKREEPPSCAPGGQLTLAKDPLFLSPWGLWGRGLLILSLGLLGCSKKTITAPDANVPVIASLVATPTVVGRGETSLIYCSAQDQDGDSLSYSWSTTSGSFLAVGGDSALKGYARWKAPDTVANATVTVTASDNRGKSAQKIVAITVSVYRLVTRWGSKGSGFGQFTNPCGIAVGPNGEVYVADAGNNRIQKFDANGVFLRDWKRGDGDTDTTHHNLKNPRGIAVDRLGYVYVVDTGNRKVQKFFDSGTNIVFQQIFIGLPRDTFGTPNGASVTENLDLYVTDYDTLYNGRVWTFPYGGTPSHWSAATPGGVAADNNGYIYVPSTGGNRVQVFGTFTGEFGDSTGQFNGPFGAAADDSGNVFITDVGNDRVVKWRRNSDNTFTYRTQFGSLGIAPNQFNSPLGIALDADYSIYVMDAGNYQVKKFSAK
jgi:hypothetical protein